ncbi:11420_t:CDS:2, partial [Funneliformis mosseae]
DMETNYNSIGIVDDSTTDNSLTKYNNDDDSIIENFNAKTDSVDFEDFYEANFENAAIEIIEDQIPQWSLNIYEVTLPNQIHQLDLGLFGYMLDYTQKLLIKQCKKWTIEEFNNRLVAIPRFPELKIFKNGITVVQIANEH